MDREWRWAFLVVAMTVLAACDDDTEILPRDDHTQPGGPGTGPSGTTTSDPPTPTPIATPTSTSTSDPPPPPPKPLPIPADEPPPAVSPGFEQVGATPLGTSGFTANARIQPRRQRLSWYVEYGTTTAYGSSTPVEKLGPKLAAYYREPWDQGLGGWLGGIEGTSLTHVTTGGRSGGHVRFTGPSDDDPNHEDGIGFLQLTQYLNSGTYVSSDLPNLYLGAGDTDMRDARIELDVRATNWIPNGSELVFWAQADSDLAEQNGLNWRRANWAYTGAPLTDALLASGWNHVDYRLRNDTNLWSYAGRSVAQNRPNYQYWPLERVLRHLNCDFLHALLLHDLAYIPSGFIDYDELTITYRNHSLLQRSNGARLVSYPAGTNGAAVADGWRWGSGKTWTSPPNPSAPQEIVYSFVRPVTINAIQFHQDPTYPAKFVDFLVSTDGLTWTTVGSDFVPQSSPHGPNYPQLFLRNLNATAQHFKVKVVSGYQSAAWGIGEVEVYGTGALMDTDDDWYTVNTDIAGLTAGTTYHYRVVVTDGVTPVYGPDQTFTTLATSLPNLLTGAASRVASSTARLDGRIVPMGTETTYWFELGPTASYGETTTPTYAGVETTPRTVVEALAGLTPATTYHYRLVATNASGTAYGADRTFTTK